MERVRIAIIDANNTSHMGFLDNGARDALHYYDDILHTYLTGSAYTFECKVEKDHPDAQYIQAGNKLSFIYDQKPYNLTIMQTHEEERFIELTAYGCCFELLNETAPAYTAATAKTFVEYLEIFLSETNFVQIGINEMPTKALKLEWTGETDSLLKRIYSLADNFDAEVEIVPTLNADYTLSTIVLNIYQEHSDTQQGIGEDRSDITLRYGVNVTTVKRDVDVTELYTAILPTGKDGLNLQTYAAQTVYDEDGNVLYTKPASDTKIYAPQARDRYPSNVVSESDRYILYRWDTEYSTQATLYGNALAKLKEISVPKATYEVEGYAELDIGDTVIIYDDQFQPALYLSARVTEQEISFTDSSRNRTTFDNVTEMVSQIDDSLLTRVQELASQVAQSVAGAQIQYYVSTSPTSLIGGQWSTTSPTWTDGSYIWTRTQYTANDGTITYSNPACSTGAAGANGSALYGVCDTAKTEQAKQVVCADVTSYYEGLAVNIKFTNGNSSLSPLFMKINSLDSIPVFYKGSQANAIGVATSGHNLFFAAGTTLPFVVDYDETNSSFFFTLTGEAGSYIGECSTAASDNIKVVNANAPVIMEGTRVTVKFTNANTITNPSPKLKIADVSNYMRNSDSTLFTTWAAGDTYTFAWGTILYSAQSSTNAWILVTEDGKDALSVSLSNDNHTFAGGTSSALADSVTCEVQAYKGATRVAATIGTITGQPTGMTTTITDNGTTSAAFTVTVTTSMTTTAGVLSVPVTVEGETFTKTFSYSLALQGQTGQTGQTGPAGANGKMLHATSSSSASTAAKTATLTEDFTLEAGATIAVTFTDANSASSPTLNVKNTGAKAIRTNGVAYAYWEAGGTVIFTYDGTYWQVCSSPVYANTATIGNPAAGNVYVDSNSVDIREGSTVLSTFTQNEIGFYLTALAYGTLAKIRFYDDNTQLVSQDSYLGYFRNNADNLVLHATQLLLEGSTTISGYRITLAPDVATTEPDQTAAALDQIEISCGTDGYKTLGTLLNRGGDGKPLYGTCSTTASTAAKVVTCSDVTTLYAGLTIMVNFSTANSATGEISLNVNNTGAVPVYAEGAITGSSNYFLWAANVSIIFVYDGTGWYAQGYGKSFWGSSSTAAGTRVKASSIPGFVCAKGTRVSVRFANGNTYTAGTVRLNVSTTGAIDIYLNSATVAGDSPYLWDSGTTQTFVFSGSRWEIDDPYILQKALAGGGTSITVTPKTETLTIASGSNTASLDLGEAASGIYRFSNGARISSGAVSVMSNIQDNRYLRVATSSNRTSNTTVTFNYMEVALS